MTTDPERPLPWYAGITTYQWVVFAIATAGWVFDVYEGQLYTIFKTPMFDEVLRTGTQMAPSTPIVPKIRDLHGNIGMALFLVGGAVGGLGFGMLADRLGRIRVMSLTILTYSLFSALTYFAQTAWQVELLRLLVATGTGGEWAVAAALVAETFPTRARSLASGTFHAASVLGGAMASVTGMILTDPHSWRIAYVIGLAPALLVLWIRMSLREPAGWTEARKRAAVGERMGSLNELLGAPALRKRALLGLGLGAVGLATYWGIFAWGNELMREVLGKSVPAAEVASKSSFVYLLMNMTGGLFGLLAFAPLANWKGRRMAFVFYHVGSLVMVPLTFLSARTYEQTLWLLPVMAFFVVGMHAGYAVYFPELFPTRLRATGTSFCFNVARLVSAVLVLGQGALATLFSLRERVVGMSSLFLVGLVLLVFAPETRGQDLPE